MPFYKGHPGYMTGKRAPNFVDISGQRFGRWVVLGLSPLTRKRHIKWLVKCDCGKGPFHVQGAALRRGASRQCRYHKAKMPARPGTAAGKLFRTYNKTATERGLEWGLTFDRFVQITSSPCYYTGRLPAMIVRARGNEAYIYNGIDRLDSSKGYVEGNVVPCCRDANYAKMELTEEEFYRLIREIVSHRGLL